MICTRAESETRDLFSHWLKVLFITGCVTNSRSFVMLVVCRLELRTLLSSRVRFRPMVDRIRWFVNNRFRPSQLYRNERS